MRGGNGVLLLNTQPGQVTRPVITVHSSVLIEQVNRLPFRQSQFAQGRPVNSQPQWRGPDTREGFSWGPDLSTLEFDGSNYDFDQNGRLVPRGTGNGEPAPAYDPYDFFVNGLTHQISASLAGGSDRLKYFLSGGHAYSSGFAPRADFRKINFSGRLHASLTDRLDIGLATNGAFTGGYRLQKGSNIKGVMLGILRTPPSFGNGNGKEGRAAADDPATYELPDGSQRSYRAGIYDNPYWSVNKNPFEDEVFRLLSHLSLQYRATDWLQFTARGGWDQFTDDRQSGFDRNPGIDDGLATVSSISYDGIHLESFARIHPQWSGPLALTANLGWNYVHNQTEEQTTTGRGLLPMHNFDPANTLEQEERQQTIRKKIVGALASVDLSYRNFLLLNLAARNDWSSALPAGRQTYLSYAFSSGLVFTELPKWKDTGPLSFLKIHGGYGRAANDVPAHLTQNYFLPATIHGDPFLSPGDPLVTSNGLGFQTAEVLGSNRLRPETTTSFETGLHFGLLQDRLGGRVVYYHQRTSDVLVPRELPGSSGYTHTIENAGVIRNEGVEIDLWASLLQIDNLNWDLSVNMTRNQNRIVRLPGPEEGFLLSGFTTTSSRAIAGEPYGIIYGTGFQYDDNGRLLIGTDGFPLQDTDLRVLGDPNPDWIMGIHNQIHIGSYLSVSALLEVRRGGERWCGTCGVMDYFGTSQLSANDRGQSFIFEGVLPDGTPNRAPVLLADPNAGLNSYFRQRYGFGGNTEMSMYPAGWLRLRTLSVRYDLIDLLPANSPIEEFSIRLLAHNLWLYTDYPGVDPETQFGGISNGFGLDYFNTPGARSYGTAITLRF